MQFSKKLPFVTVKFFYQNICRSECLDKAISLTFNVSHTPYHKNNTKIELLNPENSEVDVNFVKIGQVFVKIFHFTFSPLGALARRLNVLNHQFLWCEPTNFKKFFLNSAKHKRADFKETKNDVTGILRPLVAKNMKFFKKWVSKWLQWQR